MKNTNYIRSSRLFSVVNDQYYYITQHISSCTYHPVPPLKWYTKPVRTLTSQRNELIQQKYAVSAKLAYYLIAAPTLWLGLGLCYDVMSLVTLNYVRLSSFISY